MPTPQDPFAGLPPRAAQARRQQALRDQQAAAARARAAAMARSRPLPPTWAEKRRHSREMRELLRRFVAWAHQVKMPTDFPGGRGSTPAGWILFVTPDTSGPTNSPSGAQFNGSTTYIGTNAVLYEIDAVPTEDGRHYTGMGHNRRRIKTWSVGELRRVMIDLWGAEVW